MRAAILTATGIAAVAVATPVAAQQRVDFDIPAGRLDSALVIFARQARLSVDVSDPRLRQLRTQGLRGRHSAEEGLRLLLRGTGYDFRITGQSVVSLTRRRPRPAAPAPAPTASQARPPEPLVSPVPIVVTSTKHERLLSDYPGSVHVAGFDLADSLRFGGGGSEALLRELPNLTSTDLGAGRNKIFIRGVADSSFNGQTQATISQYLGEIRLNYSGPDPNLLLYDIERLEVVEGPQGTLYGAGSLGGVIQVNPRRPELDETSLAGMAALTVTQGDPGGEAAIVGNLLLGDNAAARLVAYRVRKPGYIDDPGRGLEDINTTDIAGLRASLLVEPDDDWELQFGVVAQDLSGKDGQYTDSGTDELTRNAAIAQPFDSNYMLGYATLRADLGFADLVSTSSVGLQAIDTVFDATPRGGAVPQAYLEDRNIALLAHETRLSGSSGPLSSWVAGLSLANNHDRAARFFGPVDALQQSSVVRSTTLDAALFGEATLGPWHNLSLTAGGRVSWVRQKDETEFGNSGIEIEPKRTSLRFLPTAALSWTPGGGFIAYARYREGYRPGSVQVIGSGANAVVNRFEPDEIRTTELGVRFGTQPAARLWGGLIYTNSRWNQVQADLIGTDGFPYVGNLGSGFVHYASLDLGWRPFEVLSIEATGFVTTSQLDQPSPAFASLGEEDLPNIADEGWRLSARLDQPVGDATLTVSGSIGYIGSSYLGIGAPLEIPQGKYHDTSLGARLEWGDWGFTLDVENLLDERSNRFSYGNPFFVDEGMQRTPLRPRTVRIGIDAQF